MYQMNQHFSFNTEYVFALHLLMIGLFAYFKFYCLCFLICH